MTNEAGIAQPEVPLTDEELIRACEEFTAQQAQLPQDLIEEFNDHELWITPLIVSRILTANNEE